MNLRRLQNYPNGFKLMSATGEGDEGGAAADESLNDQAKDQDNASSESQISEAEANLLKEVMSKKEKIKELSSVNESLIAKHSEVESKLAELTSKLDGVDIEEYQAMKAAQKDAEEEKLRVAGEWDKLKENLISENKREIASLNEIHASKIEEIKAGYEGELNVVPELLKTIEDLSVGQAFANSNYIGDKLVPSANMTKKLYGSHFEFNREQGVVVGYDKPAGAEDRAMLVNGTNEPLSFDDALSRIVEADADRDTIIKAVQKPGAGSSSKDTESTTESSGHDSSLHGASRISAALRAG